MNGEQQCSKNTEWRQVMVKKNETDDEDKIAFDEAMRGVKRIPLSKKIHQKTISPMRRPKSQFEKNEAEETWFFSDFETLEPVGSEDRLTFSRSSISYKILRKLYKGQYNKEAVLDLHGLTVEEARLALSQFLEKCRQNKIRHVLIIHGKGRGKTKPILKNKLNHWLRQTEIVLAFCSAEGRDGSSGALYVLLRRKGIE